MIHSLKTTVTTIAKYLNVIYSETYRQLKFTTKVIIIRVLKNLEKRLAKIRKNPF